jgi:serine protease AprX
MLLRSRSVPVLLAGVFLAFWASAQPSNESAESRGEKVLIRASKPYAGIVKEVRARGGRVTHEFKYIDAIAAEISRNALQSLKAMMPAGAITKDPVVPRPDPVDTARGRNLARTGDEARIRFDSAEPLSSSDVGAIAGAVPNAYLLNNAIIRAAPLHAAGILGEGVIVAVIDSGIRPGFANVANAVVGCQDFVGDDLGCSNFANYGHGTFVAGMITANVVFGFDPSADFRNAVLAECPECFLDPPTNTLIPMLGTAPLSSIYALRVFPPEGGSPTSRLLAAVERVIDLRERFDEGEPGGANIQVCNMSLGGPTLFAGRDLFDTTVNLMLRKGIVPVISAGNAGPATLTVGSPGTAFNALTVGAASLPHNERILRRLQFGPILGALYRPFLGVQTAFFSSRGPDADGRKDPDVTANGFASFGQGFGTTTLSLSFASGTSLSTPSVAGIAALLREAFPKATAAQIRNAIILGANPNLLEDGSTALDQGAGYVDALRAARLLDAGKAPNTFPPPSEAERLVQENVERGTRLRVQDGFVREHIRNLLPGERHDILYKVVPNTGKVEVTLNNVRPSLPPAQQNQLLGDDILLAIHTAKTSAIGEGDYRHFRFTTGGVFTVDNPETGIMRISVNGSSTNAGPISADVTVFFTERSLPGVTTGGEIEEGDQVEIPIRVPPGTKNAQFRLEWREDWGKYPTNDLDMILIPPSGPPNLQGATLNNPETVSIDKPRAGRWTVRIHGFELFTRLDRYELRIELDGKLVR